MAEPVRTSALAGLSRGRFRSSGADGEGLRLQLVEDPLLWQFAAWPDTLSAVGGSAAAVAGCETAPAPGRAAQGTAGALLRVEPLKWWLLAREVDFDRDGRRPQLDAATGLWLDLSHSRVWLRVQGEAAATLLNRFLPLDLRPEHCPVGRVMSSAVHHVGVTLWRSEQGFELLLPRGFAQSLCEQLLTVAAQFGYEFV